MNAGTSTVQTHLGELNGGVDEDEIATGEEKRVSCGFLLGMMGSQASTLRFLPFRTEAMNCAFRLSNSCMRFKDYRVYGLPETLWERFNFEEGNRRVPEAERQRLLQLQARVASGPAPAVGEVTQ